MRTPPRASTTPPRASRAFAHRAHAPQTASAHARMASSSSSASSTVSSPPRPSSRTFDARPVAHSLSSFATRRLSKSHASVTSMASASANAAAHAPNLGRGHGPLVVLYRIRRRPALPPLAPRPELAHLGLGIIQRVAHKPRLLEGLGSLSGSAGIPGPFGGGGVVGGWFWQGGVHGCSAPGPARRRPRGPAAGPGTARGSPGRAPASPRPCRGPPAWARRPRGRWAGPPWVGPGLGVVRWVVLAGGRPWLQRTAAAMTKTRVALPCTLSMAISPSL